jgi:hypothetical protein
MAVKVVKANGEDGGLVIRPLPVEDDSFTDGPIFRARHCLSESLLTITPYLGRLRRSMETAYEY